MEPSIGVIPVQEKGPYCKTHSSSGRVNANQRNSPSRAWFHSTGAQSQRSTAQNQDYAREDRCKRPPERKDQAEEVDSPCCRVQEDFPLASLRTWHLDWPLGPAVRKATIPRSSATFE